MITDVVIRWVVTVLFGLSFAECGYALAAGHGRWTSSVNHVLHLVMSVAMILMAWPFGMIVPNRPLMVFFLGAAIWFVCIGVSVASGVRNRVVTGYHAAMMAAMAWMYALMDGTLLPGPSDTSGDPPASMPSMPGMNMSNADMSGAHSAHAGWIVNVNLFITVAFAAAAGYWLYRYFMESADRTSGRPAILAHAGVLCQSFMAAGMAIMFGVTF